MSDDAGADQRRRLRLKNRRRHIITLSVAFTIVVALAAYSLGILFWNVQSPLDSLSFRPTCPTERVTPAKQPVSVQVLNAGGRSGAAGSLTEELKKRKFKVAKPGNDEDPPRHDAEVQIRYGKHAASEALTAALYFNSADMKEIERNSKKIDIVIGGDFTEPRKDDAVKEEMVPQPLPCAHEEPASQQPTSSTDAMRQLPSVGTHAIMG
ncbi:LytR C-terminal domain-containing protein [Saxibacter everestensis]|uniref:LytR C-terminal domain-containing protein n=1 Tax=Saxibacter everestensis TaxID=2909229 RepID=A0ABY8QRT1_9MICO|nr:LytR C-terminal domain-containing protein [Brevibacteriaceae bacterium ZFBP1038]